MDRWINAAWRAFWVGLGASAVLITQSLASPGSPKATNARSASQVPRYDLPWAPSVDRAPPRANELRLERDPFDDRSGHLTAAAARSGES